MKKLRWQLIIILLTGLVVGILLLGEQPGALTPLDPEPTRGGIYTEALVGNLQRLNPLLDFYNPADRDVDRLIFNGLIKFDARGVPVADLAESWGKSQDGKVYNFSLRPDLKWHDGEPLTADDIVFTIEMLREGTDIVPADIQVFWKDVEIVVLSPTQIQFRLPEPFAPFLDYVSFGILPRHLLGSMTFEQMRDAPFNLQPVGSGPFRFDRLVVENDQIQGVVLSINENYAGAKPYIEQIIFRYYPDSASALEAYRQDVVKGVSRITPDVLSAALAEPDLALYSGRLPNMTMVLLNLDNPQVPFFQDLEVRKALLSGLNRQGMIDTLLQGQAIVADGPIFPGTWASFDGLKRVEYDPQKAIDILKEAGYVLSGEQDVIRKKEDLSLSFSLIHPDDEFHTRLAETIQANWAKIGVEVILEPLPYEEVINGRLTPREYQAALVDLNFSRTPDPDPYPFWDQAQATGGQNYSQWDNRIASQYLERARVTIDMAERARLYRNFQVVFNEDVPALLLYSPVYNYAVDKEVRGVSVGPFYDTSDRFATVSEWFMVARVPVQGGASVATPIAEQ